MSSPAPFVREMDTDGDGIPDKDDFCPKRRALKVWISGRATDFDGDGCQDGVEDHDTDNDGVNDTLDRCPFTPQRYGFWSNAVDDFDGDGCYDGLEDHDDDGDEVLNSMDRCPRTGPGQTSDGAGCSRFQREEEASGKPAGAAQLQWQAAAAGRKGKQEKEPEGPDWREMRDEWFQLVRSAWVEVLLGAALSSLLTQATQVAGTLQQQLPTSPVGSVRRLSTQALDVAARSAPSPRRLMLRTVLCTCFFFAVYGYRALQRLRLPPGFPF